MSTDPRLPSFDRLDGGKWVARYAGYAGYGSVEAEALGELLRAIAAGRAPDREQKLIEALEWIADEAHKSHSPIGSPLRSRRDCQREPCKYATLVLDSVTQR